MELKKLNFLWGISLFVIGTATIVLAGSNLIGMALPDIVIRIVGIVNLVALPILVFTSIKKFKKHC